MADDIKADLDNLRLRSGQAIGRSTVASLVAMPVPQQHQFQQLPRDAADLQALLRLMAPRPGGPPASLPTRMPNINAEQQTRASTWSEEEALLLAEVAVLPIGQRHKLLAAAAADPTFKDCFLQAGSPVCVGAPGRNAAEAALRKLVKRVQAAPAHPPAPLPTEPAAAAGPALSLSVIPEYTEYGLEEQAAKAVISLKAAKEAAKRAQVSLTCVLDRSGSMSGPLIGLVKETVHFLIDQLTADDYLGLVSYASDVTEDLPLVKMTPEAKRVAHAVVQRLKTDGGTALYDGLARGMRQQMEAERVLDSTKVVQACFLCTDGQANAGPSNADQILPGLRSVQEPNDQHVTVHTFGFGQGHSAALLQSLAEAQSGVYYFVGKSQDVPTAYGDALGGLLSVVAKNVRVTVTATRGAVVRAVRAGGRITASAPAAGAGAAAPTVVTFNDIFAEETREILLQLQLPAAQAAAAGGPVAEVGLSYIDAASGAPVQVTASVAVERIGGERAEGAAPAELVYVTAMRYETVDAIEAAQKEQEVARAQGLLDLHIGRLSAGPMQSALVQQMVAQTRTARATIQPRYQFNQESIAMVSHTVQALKQQRTASSSVMPGAAPNMYDNISKSVWRNKASNDVAAAYASKQLAKP